MATHTAPITSARLPLATGRPVSWKLRLFFAAAAIGVGFWGIVHGPRYEEWRLSKASLHTLQQEQRRRPYDPIVLYYYGLRLNQAGRFLDAAPVLQMAVAIEPGSPRDRDQWAQALLGSGQTTGAFGDLKQFVSLYPHLSQSHFLIGKLYVTESSMKRAADELQRSVALDPSNADGWAFLAVADDALGNSKAALDAAHRAAQLRPNNAADHLRLASLLARRGQVDEARSEYERCVALAPGEGVPHREYARFLLAWGTHTADHALAVKEASIAAAANPADEQAQLVLGQAELAVARPAAALAPLARAADLDAYDPSPAQLMVEAEHWLGRPSDVATWQQAYNTRESFATDEADLKSRIGASPTNIALRQQLARLYGREGVVGECVRQEAAALHCAIDAPAALGAAANDLADGGHAAEALPLARRATTISNYSPVAHEALGNVLLALGDVHLAGEEYNQAASWRPEWTTRLKQKLQRAVAERAAHPPPAEIAYREARSLEADNIGPRPSAQVEVLAERAAQLDPANPNYLWYLLTVRMARHEDKAALLTAVGLLVLVPNDARAHAILASLLVDSSASAPDLKIAQQHLDAASGDPTVDATRHYALGVLALKRRQPAVAIRELSRSIRLDAHPDKAFERLAEAETLAGDAAAAAKASTQFHQSEAQKQAETEALAAIQRRPDQIAVYERAAALFDADGYPTQAAAIRAAAQRRRSGVRSAVNRGDATSGAQTTPPL